MHIGILMLSKLGIGFSNRVIQTHTRNWGCINMARRPIISSLAVKLYT